MMAKDIEDVNDEMIRQAVAGNMEPLLKRLRDKPVAMSPATTDPFGGEDAEAPADPLWVQIESAVSAGELSNAQFNQIYKTAWP